MPYIQLSTKENPNYKIMIFTEGTIIMHKSLLKVYDYATYKPIGNCVELIHKWEEQGAEIIYCTSRKAQQVELIVDVLKKYGFGGTKLYYREENQTYSDIAELIKPDILIEDDCKSIGGAAQMCITHVCKDIRQQIHSIPVSEFKGIDHLPILVSELFSI